eukprot:gene5478-7584_t
MSDVGTGIQQSQLLNSLLSECTWGIVQNIDKPKNNRTASDWKVCCSNPQTNPPHIVDNDSAAGVVIATYGTFLEDYTTIPKKERKHLKTTFTEMGCIGESFREYYYNLQSALNLQYNSIDNSNNIENKTQFSLLLSFLKLIDFLTDKSINFRIIFRTFGIDISNVAEEFNLFCEGNHPVLKPKYKLDGSDGRGDYRLKLPTYFGRVKRSSLDSNGLNLAYISNDKTIEIASNHVELDRVLMSWFGLDQSNNNLENADKNNITYSAAIRDDFTFWDQQYESDESGKILLIDNNNDNIIQVFFDDNIERDRPHIVDVRDRGSFQPIPFNVTNGKFLKRVEPYDAILDSDYYIKQIVSILSEYHK